MTKTRKTIAESLQEQKEVRPQELAEAPASSDKPKSPKPSFQQGKKGITLYYDPQVSKQLKQIALDEDRSLHDVMREAINDFFIKKRKPPLA